MLRSRSNRSKCCIRRTSPQSNDSKLFLRRSKILIWVGSIEGARVSPLLVHRTSANVRVSWARHRHSQADGHSSGVHNSKSDKLTFLIANPRRRAGEWQMGLSSNLDPLLLTQLANHDNRQSQDQGLSAAKEESKVKKIIGQQTAG